MRQFYLWITITSLSGLVIAYKLLPSNELIARIQFKGGLYNEAEKFYAGAYRRGDYSPNIIVPLMRIQQQGGNISSAIALTSELIKGHPDNAKLLRQLADLYLLSQQYDAYFNTLLALQQIEPTSNLLQELSTWYFNANDSVSRIPILEELTRTDLADRDDFLQLALFYSQEKRYEEAALEMKQARLLFPNKVTLSELLFEVRLLVQIEKPVVPLVANYLLRKKKVQEGYYTLGIFREQYPDLVDPLIQALTPWIEQEPFLETEALTILWEEGFDQDEMYQKINLLYAKAPSTPHLQSLLVTTLLDQNNLCRLLQMPLTDVEEPVVSALILFAIEQERPDLAEKLVAHRPAVAAALSVAKKEAGAREQLETMTRLWLPSADRYNLFKVAAAAHYNDLALKFGDSLFPYIGLHDDQFNTLAQIYLGMGKGALLEQKFEEASPTIGTENQAVAIALIDIAAHRIQKVEDWLEEQDVIKKSQLDTLFTAAEEAEEYSLALDLAKQRLIGNPNRTAQADYALALVQIGQESEGIALLHDLYGKNKSNKYIERDYFYALVTATKKDPSYKIFLAQFLEEREDAGHIRKELLRDFGYAYLDQLQEFDKAEHIFQTLADAPSPDLGDVQTLVALWGPKATPSQIDWIEKKAVAACWNDFGFWLQNLAQLGEFERLIAFFEEHEEEVCFNATTYFAYMDALFYEKRVCQLQETLYKVLSQFQEQADLETLSSYAELTNNLSIRQFIWEKIVEENPNQARSWQELGRILFDAHDDTRALKTLDCFFALRECDAPTDLALVESYYEYGEILHKKRHPWRADHFFYQALSCLDTIEEKGVRAQELEAILASRLSLHYRDPLALMHKAYLTSLQNPTIGADYANMLMDYGKLDAAEEILAAPFFCREESWSLHLTFPEEPLFQVEEQENSLLLTFNQQINPKELSNEQLSSPLFKRIATGIHQLYFVSDNQISYETTECGKEFFLDIRLTPTAAKETTRSALIAEARLELERRHYATTRCLICSLEDDYPEDADVAILSSSLEGLYPRWQRQVQILENATEIYPENEDLATLLTDARSPHTPYLVYERQLEQIHGQAAIQINRAQGELILSQSCDATLYLGAQFQAWDGHLASVVNSQGVSLPFHGTQNQGALYLRNEYATGSWVGGWGYVQDGGFFGATLLGGMEIPQIQGNFWARGDFQKPYWELYETLEFHGRQDRFLASMDGIYNRTFTWQIGGGARRVGIEGVPNGYISTLANAELFLNLVIPNPTFALNYGLDAEYVLHSKTEIGINGLPFNPVPLTSFEFHSLRGYLFYTWSDRLFMTLFAGGTFNRLGINSPTGGAMIQYIKPCVYEFLLSWARFPSTIAPASPETLFTGSITGRF